jgi:hypothetical protein
MDCGANGGVSCNEDGVYAGCAASETAMRTFWVATNRFAGWNEAGERLVEAEWTIFGECDASLEGQVLAGAQE